MFNLFDFILIYAAFETTLASGYRQIPINGHSSNDGPKIYKALNMDLLLPQSQNSYSEPVSSPDLQIMEKGLANRQQDEQGNNDLTIKAQSVYYEHDGKQGQTTEAQHVYVTPEIDPMNSLTQDTNNNNKAAEQTIREDEYEKWQEQQLEQQQQQQQQSLKDVTSASTGRANAYHDGNSVPFGKLITPLIKTTRQKLQKENLLSRTQTLLGTFTHPAMEKAHIYQANQQQYKIYQPENKHEATITDRFTPGEAVASEQLKKHNLNYAPIRTFSEKRPQSGLQSFPYSLAVKPSDGISNDTLKFINSYEPPPSGPVDTYNVYPNPFDNLQHYNYSEMPTAIGQQFNLDANNFEGTNDDDDKSDKESPNESIGVLPASVMTINPENGYKFNAVEGHDHPSNYPVEMYENGKEYPTPPPEWLLHHPESSSEHPTLHQSHYFYETTTEQHYKFKESPITQSTYLYNHNDVHQGANDVDSVNYYYSKPHEHDHHFIEDTTAASHRPLPEARVKKYSYFYIGRKLWYIPLYFTVWFTFYVLWLILKSIARHKVNIPNHYVNRRSLYDNYNINKIDHGSNDFIDELTGNIRHAIEAFQKKYNKFH